MVGSDVTNYIRPLYNYNKNFNKCSGEDSNALRISALLSSPKNLVKLFFQQSART